VDIVWLAIADAPQRRHVLDGLLNLAPLGEGYTFYPEKGSVADPFIPPEGPVALLVIEAGVEGAAGVGLLSTLDGQKPPVIIVSPEGSREALDVVAEGTRAQLPGHAVMCCWPHEVLVSACTLLDLLVQ